MEQDRSPMPRYSFFAHAELAVENSDVHLTARLYELSREGCRLYVMNPPPVGTSVLQSTPGHDANAVNPAEPQTG